MLKSLEIVNNRLYWLKKNKATGLLIEEPELKAIKQDLEILEILKKYFPINCYPLICDSKELEKWNKVKQWLESNKAGDNHDK